VTNGEFANRLLGKPSSDIDPALSARFEIYEANFLGGLTEALARSFPVVRTLVGAAYFEMLAYNFIRACPPRSPVVARYGEGFADFLETDSVIETVAYLPDMARLEYARLRALHAANRERWEDLHQDGVETLLRQKIMPHPSLTLIMSSYPIATIWQAHQTEPVEPLDDWLPQNVLVYRSEEELAHLVIDPLGTQWLDWLNYEPTLGAALGRIDTPEEATFALQLTLRLLMSETLVVERPKPISIQ
jgi:hypothetical protein